MSVDWSDRGNARRFVESCRDTLRYVKGIGWREWDGKRWAEIDDMPLTKISAVVDTFENDVNLATSPMEESSARRNLQRAKSEKGLSAIAKLARNMPEMQIEADAFDRQPGLVNCEDGVLDLNTGKLRAHDPALLLTRMAPVAYVGDDPCPLWEKHIQTVMAGREDMVEYLHRALGYTLSGYTDEQALFVAHGTGANGKSALLTVLKHVMGDYAQVADRNLLIKSGANAIGHNLVQLKGARFVLANETGRGNALDEVIVKQITGSDAVTGRKLYQNNQTFVPTAKVWLATNHRPTCPSQDFGVWRRIKAVPFPVKIEARVNNYHELVLKDEAGAVLRWLVAGYQKWRKGGLDEPWDVRAAVWDYQTIEDEAGIARFVNDRCVAGADMTVRQGTMYAAYEAWHKGQEEDTPFLPKRELFKRLREFGAVPQTSTDEYDFEVPILSGIELRGHAYN